MVSSFQEPITLVPIVLGCESLPRAIGCRCMVARLRTFAL